MSLIRFGWAILTLSLFGAAFTSLDLSKFERLFTIAYALIAAGVWTVLFAIHRLEERLKA